MEKHGVALLHGTSPAPPKDPASLLGNPALSRQPAFRRRSLRMLCWSLTSKRSPMASASTSQKDKRRSVCVNPEYRKLVANPGPIALPAIDAAGLRFRQRLNEKGQSDHGMPIASFKKPSVTEGNPHCRLDPAPPRGAESKAPHRREAEPGPVGPQSNFRPALPLHNDG